MKAQTQIRHFYPKSYQNVTLRFTGLNKIEKMMITSSFKIYPFVKLHTRRKGG